MARESYEQYMFEPDEIGSVQLMTFDAAVPSNMHSVEGFQYLDGGCANFSDNLSSQYNLTTNLINNEGDLPFYLTSFCAFSFVYLVVFVSHILL